MKSILAILMNRILFEGIRQIHDMNCAKGAFFWADHATNAELGVNLCFRTVRLPFPLVDALTPFAIHRTVSDAEKVSTLIRETFFFFDDCDTFDHKFPSCG